MKIVYTEGCTAYRMTVDDKDSTDMSVDDMRAILHKLVDNCDDVGTLQSMIIDYVEQFGTAEFVSRCDECGDNIYEYTLDIA